MMFHLNYQYVKNIQSGKKNNPSLTKKDYASSKGIKYNTFLDWIRTYKNYQDNKHNNVIPISGTVDNKVPKFIELSKDDYKEETVNTTATNKATLKYKDVSIEFDNDVDSLEKVLGIIKRWQSFLIRRYTFILKAQTLGAASTLQRILSRFIFLIPILKILYIYFSLRTEGK